MENIHGVIAWAGQNKMVRKALIGAEVVGLTLTLAGCVNAITTPEAKPTISPTVEVTTPTPTPTETTAPTPTETLAPTKTAAEETSRYFQPEFQLDLEGSVDGINIPFTIGLHKSIVKRAEEPVKTVSVNREDAPDLYAKFWLTICWQKYIQQNPNQSGISFAEYEDLVKNGEGEIQIAAVDENTDSQDNKILTFHPEKGFVGIFVDSSVSLPEEGNTLWSFYFGMNAKGQQVLVVTYDSILIKNARALDGHNGWSGSALVDIDVSVRFAELMELIISTDNNVLLDQRAYWRVENQVSLPDLDLFLNPLIRNTQYADRTSLLTIQK